MNRVTTPRCSSGRACRCPSLRPPPRLRSGQGADLRFFWTKASVYIIAAAAASFYLTACFLINRRSVHHHLRSLILMSAAPTPAEAPSSQSIVPSTCSLEGSASLSIKAEPDLPPDAFHGPQRSALVPGPNREEESSEGSAEDDPDDDDDMLAAGKAQGNDSAPNSFDSEGAIPSSLTPRMDAAAAPGGRQRVRIRGYRPLDELRSFAKVLITSLNREFITPRLDYSTPCPASLAEGLGDALIMGATLYAQMKIWLNDPLDECSRDMAAYFKVVHARTQARTLALYAQLHLKPGQSGQGRIRRAEPCQPLSRGVHIKKVSAAESRHHVLPAPSAH